MDEPVYLGFPVLELCKFLMYGIYYDKLQPCFDRENTQLHFIDCFVLRVRTQNIKYDVKNLKYLFDFNILNENHETFRTKNKKVVCKFKIETPKYIWKEEIIALKSKAYSFKCNDKNTKNLKGISKYQLKCL